MSDPLPPGLIHKSPCVRLPADNVHDALPYPCLLESNRRVIASVDMLAPNHELYDVWTVGSVRYRTLIAKKYCPGSAVL